MTTRHEGGTAATSIPHVTHHLDGDGIRLRATLDEHDRVFGLGQMLGALNRRGKRYRLFAKDEPSHTPEKASLYGSHPFFIVQGSKTFGVFVDYPGELVIDVGFTEKDLLEVMLPSAHFDLYLIESWDVRHIIREFLQLTGAPYLPPRWSFGYQQCRYSYPDATSIREVAAKCRDHGIPCDAIYLDIDYMKDYKIFTVDNEKFPDLPGLTRELREQGIKLIPIIDPGVKVEPGDDTYDTGLRGGHFCLDEDGAPFIGAVWPGFVHFPDFMNSNCRRWWGSLYKAFFDIGIEHFWNDMNEPAIFYTPRSLSLLRKTVSRIEATDDLGTGAVDFISSLGQFWQNEDDLRRLFHTLDDGSRVRHWDIHNLYGASMARATAEGLLSMKPAQRYFLIARSSYIGMHRYAVIWTGDNASWWEHMLAQIRMVLSLNLAGFFYCGGDIGGFGGDASPELCIRWTQLGCFTPLFRNHSTKGSRSQEPWAFDPQSLAIMREFIQVRYALLPYIYSEYLHSIQNLNPFVSPLFLHFGDPALKDIEDQFMFGNSIMVAPVHIQGARSRFVYLPECRWLYWNLTAWNQRDMQVLSPGSHLISVELNETPVFLRENSLLPLCAPARNGDEPLPETLEVIGFVTTRASYTLLLDDGSTWEYKQGRKASIGITVEKQGNQYRVDVQQRGPRNLCGNLQRIRFEIYDEQTAAHHSEAKISY